MRKTISLFLCLVLSLGLAAQKTNMRDYVSIRFVPNHIDWTYAVGESVEIEVAAIRHYVPIPDADVRYEWGMEQRATEKSGVLRTGKSGVQRLRLPGASQSMPLLFLLFRSPSLIAYFLLVNLLSVFLIHQQILHILV